MAYGREDDSDYLDDRDRYERSPPPPHERSPPPPRERDPGEQGPLSMLRTGRTGLSTGSSMGAGETSLFSKKMRDKLRKGMASRKQDLWKVTILEATARDDAAPKMRHVSDLLNGVNYGEQDITQGTCSTILYHFTKRLVEQDWVVVVKSLTCLHFLLSETINNEFVTGVCESKREIFNMTNFIDINPQAARNIRVVKSYGKFLYDRCTLKAEANFPPGRREDEGKMNEASARRYFREAGPDELVKIFPLLVDALESLVKVETGSAPITSTVRSLLKQDFNLLWASTNECADGIVEIFFKLDPKTKAQEARDAFHRFSFDVSDAMHRAQNQKYNPELPRAKFSEPPRDLLAEMDDHVRGQRPYNPPRMLGNERREYDGYSDQRRDLRRGGPPRLPAPAGGFFLTDDFSEGARGNAEPVFDPFADESKRRQKEEEVRRDKENEARETAAKEAQRHQRDDHDQVQAQSDGAAPYRARAVRLKDFPDTGGFDPFTDGAQQSQEYQSMGGGNFGWTGQQQQMPGQFQQQPHQARMQQQQQLMQQQQQMRMLQAQQGQQQQFLLEQQRRLAAQQQLAYPNQQQAMYYQQQQHGYSQGRW